MPAAPALRLSAFDSPVDLLLDLAERQRRDIGRISVVALVDQFVAASVQPTAQMPIESPRLAFASSPQRYVAPMISAIWVAIASISSG